LHQGLADLQSAEFIYEQSTASDVEYTFKHALTQEVAYNSILSERRKQLHERAAQAIESLFAASQTDHYDDLARHYERSGSSLKAANYLWLAALQTISRGAHAEAKDQLSKALDLLREQPAAPERDRIEISVRLGLATCLWNVPGFVGFETSASILEPALQLCEKLGDSRSLFEVLWALQLQYSVRGEYQRAHAICDELLSIATIQPAETADVEMIGQARTWRGYSLLYHGDFLKAKEDLDRVYNLPIAAAPKSEKLLFDWRIQSRAFASFILWVLGYPEAAQNIGAEALKTARQDLTSSSGQAIETAHLGFSNLDAISALWWSAAVNLLLGNWQLAQSQADSGSWLAENSGLRGLVLVFVVCHGWSLARSGRTDEGVSDLVRYRREAMTSVVSQWLFVALADAYLAGRRYAEGIAAVDEGLAEVERTGLRSHEAELRRLKGELLLLQNGVEGAARCFREAIEIARRQSAKSWELRATASLARLLIKQGDREEARTMLADIYNWFTEGFDTADLQEARQLLDQLDPI
jgi:hypothetical protein